MLDVRRLIGIGRVVDVLALELYEALQAAEAGQQTIAGLRRELETLQRQVKALEANSVALDGRATSVAEKRGDGT